MVLASAVFLGVFEFYIFYLYPHEITFGSYFSSILQAFVGGRSDKLIRINLYDKTLTLYENGNLIRQTKIAAAGHPKISPTPKGNFKILSKEKKHVSGISGLVMPFSLRFYNGYFLHGLPQTRSGKIIDTPYSNGCVRLPLGLDEEIFNWADIGTQVQIFNTNLVKSAESPTVYFLNTDGLRQPIASPEAFLRQGFRWQDVVVISQAELLSYEEGEIIN